MVGPELLFALKLTLINTLIIMSSFDVHSRDIVSSFVRDSVLDAKDFEWESQLRFYWVREEDDLVINQCQFVGTS